AGLSGAGRAVTLFVATVCPSSGAVVLCVLCRSLGYPGVFYPRQPSFFGPPSFFGISRRFSKERQRTQRTTEVVTQSSGRTARPTSPSPGTRPCLARRRACL